MMTVNNNLTGRGMQRLIPALDSTLDSGACGRRSDLFPSAGRFSALVSGQIMRSKLNSEAY